MKAFQLGESSARMNHTEFLQIIPELGQRRKLNRKRGKSFNPSMNSTMVSFKVSKKSMNKSKGRIV
jgi:hypothetical protein